MAENNYEKDLAWASSRSWDFEPMYKSLFIGHNRVPDDTPLQKDEHVDILATDFDRKILYLEEKLIRNDWPDIFVEVWSSTHNGLPGRKGWYFNTYPAHVPVLLHFGFPSSSVLLDFRKLKKWIKPTIESAAKGDPITWRKHTMPNGQHSQGYLVPIKDIPREVWYLGAGAHASHDKWHYQHNKAGTPA